MYLFDLDGTLIDSNGVWREVDNAFLSRHHCQETPEYFETIAHAIFPTAAQFTREYYQLTLQPEEIMAEWMELARDAYAFHTPMKDGAREYLERLRSEGKSLCLVTACVPELCRLVLERHGLEPFFDQVVLAQELGMEKRDPRFFPAAAELLGAAPADCILFEDAPANCAAAQSCGMTVVGVYDRFFAGREAEFQCCTRYIRSFRELL